MKPMMDERSHTSVGNCQRSGARLFWREYFSGQSPRASRTRSASLATSVTHSLPPSRLMRPSAPRRLNSRETASRCVLTRSESQPASARATGGRLRVGHRTLWRGAEVRRGCGFAPRMPGIHRLVRRDDGSGCWSEAAWWLRKLRVLPQNALEICCSHNGDEHRLEGFDAGGTRPRSKAAISPKTSPFSRSVNNKALPSGA